MQRAEDPESISTTKRLAAAKEKCLRIDAAILTIVEDEFLIAERMKKSKQMTTDHPSYMGPPRLEEETL